MEARPAEFNRASGRTARNLLFFNVKQNMINKRAIEMVCRNLQNKLQQLAYTNRVMVAQAKYKALQ